MNNGLRTKWLFISMLFLMGTMPAFAQVQWLKNLFGTAGWLANHLNDILLGIALIMAILAVWSFVKEKIVLGVIFFFCTFAVGLFLKIKGGGGAITPIIFSVTILIFCVPAAKILYWWKMKQLVKDIRNPKHEGETAMQREANAIKAISGLLALFLILAFATMFLV